MRKSARRLRGAPTAAPSSEGAPTDGVSSGGGRGGRRRKKATNLTLDPAAVARGEEYGARHGRKLSQLVNGFLLALPGAEVAADGAAGDAIADLSPAVRRLYGVAAGAPEGTAEEGTEAAKSSDARLAHRAHLAAKYGAPSERPG